MGLKGIDMTTNLQFITSSSGENIADLSITNCFSAQYNVYQVILDTIEFASGDMSFRFINSSGTVTSANYDDAVLLQRSYGAYADNNNEDATSLGSIGFDDDQNGGGATFITVYNPFASDTYTYANWQNTGQSGIGTPVRRGIGVLTVAESHTGINLVGNATIEKVSARVYGVL